MRWAIAAAAVVLGWALLVASALSWIQEAQLAVGEATDATVLVGSGVDALPAAAETATTSLPAPLPVLVQPALVAIAEEEVDYPDPVRLEIPSQNIAAEIDGTGPAFGRLIFNPRRGRLDWWLGDNTVGPCEQGPVFILGHVTGKFRNLVDDPAIRGDSGVVAGDAVSIQLADGTVCLYRVVDFLSAFGEEVPGTPARRFRKDDWAGYDWSNVIQENGDKPSLFLLTSGGTVFETVNNERHRVYVDVVKAVLEDISSP